MGAVLHRYLINIVFKIDDISNECSKNMEEIKMEVRIFALISKVTKLPQEELDPTLDIFESNIISSLGLLELVAQMESEFSITIDSEELIHENFGTIQLILKFLKKRKEE